MTARGLSRRAATAGDSGFALFIVLWFLVLLAAVGIYLLASARTETALAHNGLAAAHAEALADGGVAQAIFNQSQGDPTKRWALNGTPYTVTLPGGSLTLRLADENEKINPSRASPDLLAALWVALGTQPPTAAQLASAIADWTRAQPKGASGPADDPYRDAGLDYEPPHRPLESLDELRFVIGMTPAMFDAARAYLTIYGESDAPDPQGAAPVVVQALAAVATRATGSTSASSTGTGAAGMNAADAGAAGSNDASATAAPANGVPASSSSPTNGAAPSATASTPAVITIDATAASRDGGVFVRHAVVSIDSDTPKGYTVLAWDRGQLGP